MNTDKRFLKIFLLLFVVNLAVAIVIYLVSPGQVPSRFKDGIFSGYRSSITVFSPLLFEAFLLIVWWLTQLMLPFSISVFKQYPQSYQKMTLSILAFFLGIPKGSQPLDILLGKGTSAIALVLSFLLIPAQFVGLAFSFQSPAITQYVIGLFLGFVVLSIPVTRFFFKRVE